MLSRIFDFPKPKSDEIFEDIICDIYSREFQNPNLQRYGRSGQAQNGIDVLGVSIGGINYPINELVAIQCKNHIKDITDTKLQKEIVDEVTKFEENSKWEIDRYLFATSADNSKPMHDFVLSLNTERCKHKKFPIEVIFWDHITKRLDRHSDLLYKYFTKYLPVGQAENIEIPDFKKTNRTTLQYFSSDFLESENNNEILQKTQQHLTTKMGNLPKSSAHKLYIGITVKNTSIFDKLTDLTINFQEYYSDTSKLEDKFEKITTILKNIVLVISDSFFSKNIVIYLDAEISLALLLGRALRRNGLSAHIVFKDQIWSSKQSDTPYVPSDINQDTPVVLDDADESHVAYYFNACGTANRKNYALENIKSWQVKPKYFLAYDLNGFKINSSSHAFSIANQVIKTIHNIENWNVKHIHVFLIVPKALALLIGNLLNTLNSNIHVYFLDTDRSRYLEAGVITNNTF